MKMPTPGESDRYIFALVHVLSTLAFLTLHDVRQPILFASQVLFQLYAFLAGVQSLPGVLHVQGQVIPFILVYTHPVQYTMRKCHLGLSVC